MRRDNDRDPTAWLQRAIPANDRQETGGFLSKLRASSSPCVAVLRQHHIEGLGVHSMSLHVGERGALFVASALLALTPFFVVTFPPITDLPQHLAQVRLFGEALADPHGPYGIQWWTPYSLQYALLGLCRAIAPPLLAGRLAFAICALLWVATAHALAANRARSPPAAVLVSLFVFCNVLYWGFLSFAIGWPVFAAWMLAADREIGYSTVLKFMQIMADKGLVRRNVKQRAHIYEPARPPEWTQRQLADDLLQRAFNGSAKSLMMGALSARKASKKELTELRRLLDDYEKGAR